MELSPSKYPPPNPTPPPPPFPPQAYHQRPPPPQSYYHQPPPPTQAPPQSYHQQTPSSTPFPPPPYHQQPPPPTQFFPPQSYHQPPSPFHPQAYHQQPTPPQSYHQQPAPLTQTLKPVNVEWASSFWICCCSAEYCKTFCCPCITFGHIAEIVDRGNTSCLLQGTIYALIRHFTGCGCIYSAMYRTKIRNKFGLRESPCNDYLLHICCETRALCQEYRELKRRGFDLPIGNEARQNYGLQMPPMPPQNMQR